MRAARSLQDAFNLRSTVAVLGFAIRTLAQMLGEGKLDELVAQTRSETPRDSFRRDDGGNHRGQDNFNPDNEARGAKPNPFARPEKPQPATSQEESSLSDQSDLNKEDSSNNPEEVKEQMEDANENNQNESTQDDDALAEGKE